MSKKMLIVDDEPIIREILRETFEACDFVVHEAENGRKAFQLIQEISYDCVLSDVRMPGGDGVELAKNIFQIAEKKPKLFLITGHAEGVAELVKDCGVIKVFDKPFNFRELMTQVCESF
jgi:YesN/AraC family two-component response regulator